MKKEIPVRSIGAHACHTLSGERSGTIIGVISRGLYARIDTHIIFISYEQYRSPITITFDTPPAHCRVVENNTAVYTARGRLEFPAQWFSISAAGTDPWHPAAARQPPGAFTDQHRRLLNLAKKAALEKGDLGLSPLLPHILDFPEKQALNQQLSGVMKTITGLQTALRSLDITRAAEVLKDLLGLGRGLTPAGDDFILGFLLSLNRWKHHLQPRFNLETLNQKITDLAYRQTTTLSANVIECAASGEADERLVRTVDHIFTGEHEAGTCLDELAGMGSSSGVDALVGMAVALAYPRNMLSYIPV